MTLHRRLALPLGLLLLGLAAAPAQATLLVKSDSTGLLVQDKNGIGDRVVVTSGTQGGNAVYVVTNQNAFDVFKFDRRDNCSEGATGDKAVCRRFSGKLNLAMVGGDDEVRVGSSGASRVSANLGGGNDLYEGISGVDDIFTAAGNDDVSTREGADDITLTRGEHHVVAGAGADTIDTTLSNTDFGADTIDAGSGDDEVLLSQPLVEAPLEVFGGDGNDTINTGAGSDLVAGMNGEDSISTGKGEDEILVKEGLTPERDTVFCGFQQDSVVADSTDVIDAITNPGGGTCEEVDRSPVRETPHVKILNAKRLRVARSGRTKVRLRCPRGVHKLGCKGSLRLTGKSSRSRRVRYRIKAGRRKGVRLRVRRRDVRALRRRQRRGKTTRGILVSVEKGRRGRKTTIRNPRLRVR